MRHLQALHHVLLDQQDGDALARGCALISANSSSTRSGERPSDGSSRMSSLGSAIRPRPIASICCSPPDSVPARWPCRSARRGKIENTRPRLSFAGRERGDRRRDRDFRGPSYSGRCAGLPAHESGPRDDRAPAVLLRSARRRSGSCRASSRITPEMVRLSVDLPAPFEPSTATISPAPTLRSTPRRISVAP